MNNNDIYYKQCKIRDLIQYLNARTKEYDEGQPTISDQAWDQKYFELVELEKETGLIYPDSPTQSISYTIVTNLKKVEHSHKMLSLAKTKSIDDVKKFIMNEDFVAMAKMDGLTCSLRYVNGFLVSAETRGNGIIGEDITHNAKVIKSIPQNINYLNELVIDGEVVCLDDDFIEFSKDYKNSRNFASGSIRLLDSNECAKRKLTFVAWDVIKGGETNSFISNLMFIKHLGFTIVPWVAENPSYAIKDLQEQCHRIGYPIDGIVFKFDNIEYSKTLGETAHHFNNAIAYKFADEEFETKLLNIEWSMGRTGILTPVAVFEPVDDGDSIIERASLHNLNIMRETLGDYPYKGQKIWVCKQNMIIPQISKAEKIDLGHYYEDDLVSPSVCPICGQPTAINESDQLYCTNPDCEGKFLNKLDHFCGKKGLDIKGISKTTLEKVIDYGWVNSFKDIFYLNTYVKEWAKKPGFGEKSVNRILAAIDQARTTTLDKFISAIGIPLVGQTIAKDLIKNGITTYEDLRQRVSDRFDFSVFDGFGPEKTFSLWDYDYSMADEVVKELTFISADLAIASPDKSKLAGLSIAVTGKLEAFKNREEIKEFIEKNGGKMVTAVSSKTACLINNDINGTSSKNLTAKKLNVPIFGEKQFIEHYSLKL